MQRDRCGEERSFARVSLGEVAFREGRSGEESGQVIAPGPDRRRWKNQPMPEDEVELDNDVRQGPQPTAVLLRVHVLLVRKAGR
jgi:hypothetical protein